MQCPYCNCKESKVIDSRHTDSTSVRRRRECENCKKRFTTYERIEFAQIMVIKRDGSRQPFDRDKIKYGLLRACEKRPISSQSIEDVIKNIENELSRKFIEEIETNKIGDMVMRELRNLDEVAYVRFASVYKQFNDINNFVKELEKILIEKGSETNE
ncbi:MAG: transcriptional regulator NrdR [Clostridioides sp.]|jgi:transcriptional repressor NrdR|nr:transcriptional regulator NrdR [Clostridioides sp.]